VETRNYSRGGGLEPTCESWRESPVSTLRIEATFGDRFDKIDDRLADPDCSPWKRRASLAIERRLDPRSAKNTKGLRAWSVSTWCQLAIHITPANTISVDERKI